MAFISVSKCTNPGACGGESACPECYECWQRLLVTEKECEEDLRKLRFQSNSKNTPPTPGDSFWGWAGILDSLHGGSKWTRQRHLPRNAVSS